MRTEVKNVKPGASTSDFYLFTANVSGKPATRIIDKKGFIKVQRGESTAQLCTIADYQETVSHYYKDFVTFTTDSCLRPDFYIAIGPRLMDFSGSMTLEQLFGLIEIELIGVDAQTPILVTAVRNNMGL